MARYAPARSAQNDDQAYQQPIRLKEGMYSGMFARYSEPKKMPKFQKPDELEEKIALTFVVTHAANEKRLPQFSEAFTMPRLVLSYDPDGRWSSTYFQFLQALLGGKMTAEQICAASDDELPDLDDLIGYPATFFIKPSTKANSKGIFPNKIASFVPPTKTLKAEIFPLFKAMETDTSEKSGLRYLKSPHAAYEVADDLSAPAAETYEDEFDDVPF